MIETFELVAPGGVASDPHAEPVVWPALPRSGTFATDLSWDLNELGVQRAASADLLRIAVAAYLADRSASRGATTWTREIALRVPVSDVALWSGEAGERVVDLLWWLTGDLWELQPVAGELFVPTGLPLPGSQRAVLLSGGLDSLCGALLLKPMNESALLLGHAGTENVVRRSQKRVHEYVLARRPAYDSVRVSLSRAANKESTSRTRSLLFMTLGAAAAVDGGTLAVPENGFTSVNLALRQGRGGACSTRSTHPVTFQQVNGVLTAAGISVTVFNPHAGQTKGQMVKGASGTPGFDEIAAATMSCSKLNGRTYTKGDANTHCGLCVACVVRRAAFLGGGVTDATEYLVHRLPKASRAKLIRHRQSDIDAIRYATTKIPPIAQIEDRLIAAASWASDADRSAAAKVYRAGLKELALVSLP